MSSQAFSLAVWESLFPACVVRGRANLLLSFHSAAPIPLQSLSVFSLLLAVAGQQEEAPSLFHISSPLKYPLDVVLPFSYIRGRFVYCPFFLVQFNGHQALCNTENCNCLGQFLILYTWIIAQQRSNSNHFTEAASYRAVKKQSHPPLLHLLCAVHRGWRSARKTS